MAFTDPNPKQTLGFLLSHDGCVTKMSNAVSSNGIFFYFFCNLSELSDRKHHMIYLSSYNKSSPFTIRIFILKFLFGIYIKHRWPK